MRITIHETNLLNAIGKCHPVKSSYAKLAKETGKARNEVEEIVTGLKKIGYVNVTAANEVYLLEDGRKYLGIGSNKPESSKALDKKPVIHALVKEERNQEVSNNEKQLSSNAEAAEQAQKSKKELRNERAVKVSLSIAELAVKLDKPTVEIADLELKSKSLTNLANLMADDIAELLLEIKSDLERAAA